MMISKMNIITEKEDNSEIWYITGGESEYSFGKKMEYCSNLLKDIEIYIENLMKELEENKKESPKIIENLMEKSIIEIKNKKKQSEILSKQKEEFLRINKINDRFKKMVITQRGILNNYFLKYISDKKKKAREKSFKYSN